MKSRFTNVDVFAIVNDLQGLIGMRVNNVYDIDHKTYLIRFVKSDFKAMLLFESGVRIHTTEFGWSKNILPSSFSMKLRKHLRQKRLEAVKQVDHDRIIDFEFGSGEFTHHVIVELYDRGNVVLTDREYMILNILRPRTDKDTDVRYAVRQCYFPEGRKRDSTPSVACKIDSDYVRELISNCNAKENLQKVLASKYPYGSALLEHCCRKENVSFKWTAKKVLEQENGMDGLLRALQASQALYEQLRTEPCKGYITFRQERNSAGETIEIQEEADKADELDQENVEQHVGISRLDDSEERKNEDEFSFPDVKVDLKFLEPSTEEAELTSIVPPMDSRKAPKQVQVQPAAIRRKERKKLRKAKALANKKGSTVPAANEAGAMEEQPDNVDVVAAGEQAGKPELTVKDDEEITIEKGEDLQSVPDEEHAADEEPEDVSAFAEETLNAVQCLVGNLQSNYVPLYALPVCGPYSAMSNFTYKVKLTPGTTKKSSAVKTALHLFLQDKTVGGVSKDLLKVMREQDMSRNIPGKVKVSAPHLSSAKKR